MTRRILATIGIVSVFGLVLLLIAGSALAGGRDTQRGQHAHAAGTTISLEQARDAAVAYSAGIGFGSNGYDGVLVGDVIQIQNHFYVEMVDEVTGDGAFSLIVSGDGTFVHPDHTATWNTRYDLITALTTSMRAMMDSGMMDSGTMDSGTMDSGMMDSGMMDSGMMDSGTMDSGTMDSGMMESTGSHLQQNRGEMPMGQMHEMMSADQSMMTVADCPNLDGMPSDSSELLAEPLTSTEAVVAAQTWLDEQAAGVIVTDANVFPGYVTVRTAREGAITGVLSIQTSTGVVWQHPQHGDGMALNVD